MSYLPALNPAASRWTRNCCTVNLSKWDYTKVLFRRYIPISWTSSLRQIVCVLYFSPCCQVKLAVIQTGNDIVSSLQTTYKKSSWNNENHANAIPAIYLPVTTNIVSVKQLYIHLATLSHQQISLILHGIVWQQNQANLTVSTDQCTTSWSSSYILKMSHLNATEHKSVSDLSVQGNSKLSLFSLPHLSAVFDTTDHSILLSCLNTSFGLCGSILFWFHSYLCSCTKAITVNGSKSLRTVLQFSVHQGSVLRPFSFVHPTFLWHSHTSQLLWRLSPLCLSTSQWASWNNFILTDLHFQCSSLAASHQSADKTEMISPL